MATKPRLSRQYLYLPFSELSFDLSTADVHQVALMSDPTAEPAEADWLDAIVVTSGHDLYVESIGDSLAILVGPDRGDTVDTEDLPAGEYTAWTDVSTPGSDERLADWHGTVTVVTAPEVAA